MQKTLIIGASSAIAKGLITRLAVDANTCLTLISRNIEPYGHDQEPKIEQISVKDYSEQSIAQAVSQIELPLNMSISRIFICTGILHSASIKVEKRLEDLNSDTLIQVMQANALTPLLWIKHLTPLLKDKQPCKVVVLSARVGSISDNRFGGWYSYRASKAALNMMLKNVGIEMARTRKNIKIIAFHPGTTDTPLSKPFQKNVPKGKLFSCDFVAKQLLTLTDEFVPDGKTSFIDWQGKPIDW